MARPAGAGGNIRTGRRARLDPETRRAQLVETAATLLDEQGLAALTVEEVADAAGVSRSLVYSYFGDRDGLAAEVYIRILDQLDRELGLSLPFDEAALARMVRECMAFAQRYRAGWRMLVSDPARQHATVREARAARAVRLASYWSPGGQDEPSLDLAAGAPGADGGAPVPSPASARERGEGAIGEPPTAGSEDDGQAGDPSALAGPPLAAEAVLGMLEAGVQHWLDHPEVPAEQARSLLTTLLWRGLRGRGNKDREASLRK